MIWLGLGVFIVVSLLPLFGAYAINESQYRRDGGVYIPQKRTAKRGYGAVRMRRFW